MKQEVCLIAMLCRKSRDSSAVFGGTTRYTCYGALSSFKKETELLYDSSNNVDLK